jgi:LysM repeat protein
MAEQDMLNALDDCINRLADGQSLEDCLRRYPKFASTLRPMLETGRLVNRAQFSPAEIRESQDRVRFRVGEAVRSRGNRQRTLLSRTLPLVASFALVFVLALGATSILAESSLPGSPIYGLKRFTENARLIFATDREALEQQFDQRRVSEVERLIVERRAAEVMFEGELEAVNGTTWQVEGLPVHVSPETPGAASVQTGDTIEVRALTTAEGEIVATSIRLVSGDESPIPTLAPSTDVPIQTSSPTTIVTQTPTPGASITPIRTPTSSPTPENRLPPSATPCIPTQPGGWVEYSVQPNDNLSSLAVTAGVTVEELMRVNCLTDRGLIVTGQRLYLPFEPGISPTQTRPEVHSTEVEGRHDDNRDNSGPGSNNSGEGEGDDDGEEGDNSGRGSEDNNSGQGSDDDNSGRGGSDN